MSANNSQNEENQSLSVWELFQGLFAMIIGVQSEEKRARQMKYGKPYQFLLIGLGVSLTFIFGMYFLMRLALRLAGV